MVGVALGTSSPVHGYFKTNAAWMFNLNNGNMYSDGSAYLYFPYPRFAPQNGDIITVQVNMKRKLITILINGVSLGVAMKMDIDNNETNQLAPAVDFRNAGDIVRFL